MLDFIGAARPSIADPFLPRKIEQGRIDDIRECIGCNICVSADYTLVPMRCTQNPTAGEEWRKGWHPERIPPKASEASVLVVGAGPAGLECARALGERGYAVTLADSRDELGGRVTIESRLPGLSEWARVRDYRLQQLERLINVEVFRESSLGVEHVLELAPDHVVVATGSHWRADGLGRTHDSPIDGWQCRSVVTPDQILADLETSSPVVVYDDDHYYMASSIAERLAELGHDVTIVTPAADVCDWSENTLERPFVEERLHELGVRIIEKHRLQHVADDGVTVSHVFSGHTIDIDAANVVMVTMRDPETVLFTALDDDRDALREAGIASVTRIGDCLSPSTIAAAVYAGHRYARELDESERPEIAFRRERVQMT